MLIKSIDDKTHQLTALENLLSESQPLLKKKIEEELRILRAGVKGEKDTAYLLDFDLKESRNWMVIHDLRIELGGRVAQIDHLIITRVMEFFVIETKSFHAGLKITEEGEFLRWNEWKKTFEGMPSPLQQNERHISVLKEAIEKQVDLPSRLGMTLQPKFKSFVLVSAKSRIDRPKGFDTTNVVKADAFVRLVSNVEDVGLGEALLAVSKVVSSETIEGVARQIAKLHQPAEINYRAKLGLVNETNLNGKNPPASEVPTHTPSSSLIAQFCRSCNSNDLSIQHGKYGYYFKCSACDANTPIKIGCGQQSHKERIRKEGVKFFRECAECGTSKLFFQNAR